MEEIVRSEIGAEAAWRGFSTQTLYIANRLLNVEEGVELFPESVEDLMLKKDNNVIELVQVKNLSDDLTLSDLSPRKSDSFFRRCLKYKNNHICLKVVAFGNVGKELSDLLISNDISKSAVYQKLLLYGYEQDDIIWLLSNFIIEQVSEAELENSLRKQLMEYIEISASFDLAFESIIFYIYNLSRKKGCTSKVLLQGHIDNIAKNIMSANSISRQYQKTIIPLYEYRCNKTKGELLNDYRMGVNANPDHMRNNCDLLRKRWLNELESRFLKHNIVVIKGMSGQGKSTLAYRYLIDSYPELNVMCIQKITSQEQANDIVSVLRGLNARKEIIAYLDVEPYDNQWLWICEKILDFGLEIKVLITIREDDFQRSPMDYSKHKLEILTLDLSKDEAEEIYKIYPENGYLSFDAAWKSFGEKGPLMEYIFMLNYSETMKDRLRAQMERIILNESEADSWLKCLGIISLAGMHNNILSIDKLFQYVECDQKQKMLKSFEREYFVRVSSNNEYLESLHVLRAKLIYEILVDKSICQREQMLITTLGVIEHNATQMIIEYVYEKNITNEMVSKLIKIEYQNIEIYADVIKALLWCEMYVYAKTNERIIQEGDVRINNFALAIGKADVTGLLNIEDETEEMIKTVNTIFPNSETVIRNLLNKLPMKTMDYRFLDHFMEETYDQLSERYVLLKPSELTAWGYVLFWLAQRGFFVTKFPGDMDINWKENIDKALNYSLGICMQNNYGLRDEIATEILPIIWKENGVIFEDHEGDEVLGYIDVLSECSESESHKRLMKMIGIYRRLFPEKKKYNVKIIGYEFLGEIKVPDTEKHIPSKNLPFVWITQLNRYYRNYREYELRLESWKNVYDEIICIRNAIMSFLEILQSAVEKLYKKDNSSVFRSDDFKNQLALAEKLLTRDLIKEPKCAMDRYGIRENNNVVENYGNKYSSEKNDDSDKNSMLSLSRKYFEAIRIFCQNCLTIIAEARTHQEQSQNARIAYFNLMRALFDLEQFQREFNEFFSRYDSFPVERETEVMETIAAVFTVISFDRPVREASIVYRAKESIKKLERKIDDFLNIGLKNLPGVMETEYTAREAAVIVKISQLEEFLQGLYKSVIDLANDISSYSFTGFVLTKKMTGITIKIIYERNIINQSILIPVTNFLIYQDYGRFKNALMLSNASNISEIENIPLKKFIQGNAAIGLLNRMFFYIREIESELNDRCESKIISEVHDEYQNRTINMVTQSVNELKEVFQYFENNAPNNESGIHQLSIVAENAVKQLNEDPFSSKSHEAFSIIKACFVKLQEYI